MVIRADTLDVEAFKIDSSKSKIDVRGEFENIRVPIRVRDRHTFLTSEFSWKIELNDVMRMSLNEPYLVRWLNGNDDL